MDYEIIATLGPSSMAETTWQAMLDAGATAFRLNTSHLTLVQLQDWLDRLNPFLASQKTRIPLVLDLQGSKWRVGDFTPFELKAGERVELVRGATSPRAGVLPVPHADFFAAASESNGEIILNDAKIRLRMETAGPETVRAQITQGGTISPHKGITFAASTYRSETLSEKDQAIFAQTRGLGFVQYAISYVKDGAEMERYRELVGEFIGGPTYLIAKLERGPAMAEAARIARSADALWLCRGDLGAELGLRDMAVAVERFSDQISAFGAPAIMAGQVLEHMTEHPTPTRSEVCYLYDTLRRGYQGFVLSDEAAIGRYPVESCRVAGMYKP